MTFNNSILTIFFFCVFLFGCKNIHETTLSNSGVKSCHIPTDSLLGRGYLAKRFLDKIKFIKPDIKQLGSTDGMVLIEGGEFEMGADIQKGFENLTPTALPQPDEYPKHFVQVSDFYMDEHEVSVGEYLAFVQATSYKTVAEHDIDWEELKKQVPNGTPKPPEDALKAGSLVFQYVPQSTSKENLGNWWTFISGVNWKNPDGTNPLIKDILNFPVTQISWYDAMAYAKWIGKRLPTEAEYEYAMRGGSKNKMYPWGNEKLNDEVYRGNFLQGEFPYYNTKGDGFETIAPIKSFPPNPYGLYDISGNVWEWTNDWYSAIYYKTLKDQDETAINPKGPSKTIEVHDHNATNKVVRGGSFLCNDNWCSGYRNARRMRLSPDTGMQHLGFRLVRDI